MKKQFTNKARYLGLKLTAIVFALLLFVSGQSWGQSYLGLDGGLEGSATIDNSGTTGPSASKWTKNNTTQTIAVETTTKRSGSNSLRINNTSTTGRRVWSPLITVSSQTTAVTIQYYRFVVSATNSQSNQEGTYRSVTENLQGTYDTPSAGTWEKQTYSPASSTFTNIAGVIMHKQIGTGGDLFIDDMCIYAGAVDNTVPDAPTAAIVGTPTISSLNVSWTAPSTGVDGGGYLVVRGISDPTTAPNANGIYAVNNTIASGMTVVYQGTSTSFTDNTGMSAGTTYYYRIYTYDKAYNYCSSPLTGSGTTSSAGTPTLLVGALSGSFGNQCINGIYGPYSFTISGSSLTTDPITLAALSGFTYSESETGTYTSTLSITQGGGSYGPTPVYVKFSPTAVQSYNGDIAVGGGGASSINRSVTGSGINTAPTVTTPTSTNLTATTATLGGNITVVGCADVTERGIYWSTTNGFANGTGTKVSETPGPYTTGVFTIPVTGLPQGSTVYFKAFATSTVGSAYTTQASFTTIKDEPSNHATAFSANQGSPSYSSIIVTWTDATGTVLPDGYLIKASTGSITAPVDGTAEADAALVKNIAAGVQTVTFTSLTPSTSYNFEIYPYTNSGGNINYKLDGTVPTATTATAAMPWIEDFEGASAYTNYNIGTPVTCTKGNWSMVEALVGNLAGDKKNGANAARLRNANGYIAMLFDKTNGAGTVTVSHATYSTDGNSTWKLQMSIDGGTVWTDIGSTITSSSTLTPQIFTVNQSGNVRFKILHVTGGSSARLNIDDITISDYAASNPTTSTFTGTYSNAWEITANWDNGNPISTTNVTIPAGKTVVVNSNYHECNNLTIASTGALTVNTDKDLLINGTLLLQSDTNGCASFIDNGTVVYDNATVERYLTGNVFHQLGLPISDTIAAGTSAGQTGDVFKYCTIDYYNESSNTYTGLTASNTVTPDKGYVVKYVYGASAPAYRTLSFTGTLNTGDKPYSISYSGTGANDPFKGYNMIPNPYPSAINGDIDTWAKTNVSNSIWVWDQSSTSPEPTGNYLTWNGSTGTLTDGIIPAMQAFFIQTNNANPLITIPNSARTHSNQAYYKSTVTDELTLKVKGNNYSDAIIVTFTPNATNNFDNNFDVRKLYGLQAAPQLFSLCNSEKLSINGLAPITTSVALPVGLQVGNNGNYTINADGVNTFATCSSIILEDLKTNTTQNLMQNPVYSFAAATTDNANRFVLHFATAVGVNEIGNSNGSIYAYDNSIYVNANEQIKQISVYNAMGQLVKTLNNVNGLQKINMNGNATGYYIVRVVSDKNVYSEKVLVK